MVPPRPRGRPDPTCHRVRSQLREVRRPFGVSNTDQVWTHVNGYRRKFLAANHNSEEGTIFVPTNLLTYFRPDGLSSQSCVPVRHPARESTDGVEWRALRQAVSDSQPSGVDATAVPLEYLGPRDRLSPQAIGKVARTRLLLLAAGERRRRIDVVGLHRAKVPG